MTATEELALLRDFNAHALAYWRLPAKSGGYVRFKPNRAQKIVLANYNDQMDRRGFVRQNNLKCRQVGDTTLWRSMALKYCMSRSGVTALTIAHDLQLPEQWLLRCRELREQTPEYARPKTEATRGHELRWDNGSRYYIGSAQGGFPGMGDTIHFLHLSEVGRWDKPPVSVDPVKVLAPLTPAIPVGAYRGGTVAIRESTGVMVGDHWHGLWQAGKDRDDEYENIFLPWFLVDEYRLDELAHDVIDLTDYEKDLVKIASGHGIDLDHAQIAWRRNEIKQQPWLGNEELWAAEYPATETEAFMSPGLAVYTGEMQRLAATTKREPVWRGDIHPKPNPIEYTLLGGEAGQMLIWDHDPVKGERPDERYHFVLGADCQWGDKKTADFDCLHIECLETGKVCAKVRGHFDLASWGKIIASVGYYYNACPVAPERNALASSALMPLLLGNVSDWRYPNIWVRTDDVSMKGHRPQDYGWLTTEHTKQELIQYSQTATIEGGFDWCDEGSISQMATIIRREDGTVGAPKGAFDDDWMSRLITAYVAHKQRPRTDLFVDRPPEVFRFNTMSDRLQEQIRSENA